MEIGEGGVEGRGPACSLAGTGRSQLRAGSAGPARLLPGPGGVIGKSLAQLTPVMSESRPLLSSAVNSVQGLCLL